MDLLWPDLGRRAASNNLRSALHAARGSSTRTRVIAIWPRRMGGLRCARIVLCGWTSMPSCGRRRPGSPKTLQPTVRPSNCASESSCLKNATRGGPRPGARGCANCTSRECFEHRGYCLANQPRYGCCKLHLYALPKSASARGSFDRFWADIDSSPHCPCRRLCAATIGDGSRTRVEEFLGRLGFQADELLGSLGSYLFGAHLVPDRPIVRRANPSMGLRPAKATSPAHFHTALGDPADVAGTVLGQPYELFVFYRLRKPGESGAGNQPGARGT